MGRMTRQKIQFYLFCQVIVTSEISVFRLIYLVMIYYLVTLLGTCSTPHSPSTGYHSKHIYLHTNVVLALTAGFQIFSPSPTCYMYHKTQISNFIFRKSALSVSARTARRVSLKRPVDRPLSVAVPSVTYSPRETSRVMTYSDSRLKTFAPSWNEKASILYCAQRRMTLLS